MLKYAAKADVGGKIAQLGSRLITSTSKKLAGQFFSTLQREGGRLSRLAQAYSNTMLGTAASAAPRSSLTRSQTLAAISR